MKFKNFFIKLFAGFIVYYALIGSLEFIYLNLATPREALLHPLYVLFIAPDIGAWITLVGCEMMSFTVIHINNKENKEMKK